MLKKIQSVYDKVLTVIAAILLAVMFCVLVANVILRLVPSVGGFKWYMEFSQYANVWAMLIGAAGIAAMGTNLRVEAVDGIFSKIKYGNKIARTIVDVFLIVYYYYITKSGMVLSQKAVQKVSTMQQFTMGQVYKIFPIAGVLCIIGAIINLLVVWTSKDEDLAKTNDEGGVA